MITIPDGRALPKGRPGPKPRGRNVVPLTITVTPAQRAELEARADAQQTSISAVIRQFITTGLATSALYILTALIEITITRRTDAEKPETPPTPAGESHRSGSEQHEPRVTPPTCSAT